MSSFTIVYDPHPIIELPVCYGYSSHGIQLLLFTKYCGFYKEVVVTELKIDKVPLEQKGWNAVQQPIQTGTKCGLVRFWKFMLNAILMHSILMFDFKNDHDLIEINLSLDVSSRYQSSNK